ncbi:MAG: hypothetical protein LUG98_02060 [Tannerellaceae bacterium]|nr:hypothetical protein [Tannerellaceae bacterium]
MKTSGSNFILCFLLSLYIGIHIFSCDPGKRLAVNGQKDYYLFSDCGNMSLRSHWSMQRLFVVFQLDGTFDVYPDSLKLGFYPDTLQTAGIDFYVNKGMVPGNEVIHVENGIVKMVHRGDFYAITKDRSTKRFFILPCNFIMCNGKPLITDTIIIN